MCKKCAHADVARNGKRAQYGVLEKCDAEVAALMRPIHGESGEK